MRKIVADSPALRSAVADERWFIISSLCRIVTYPPMIDATMRLDRVIGLRADGLRSARMLWAAVQSSRRLEKRPD